MSLDQPLLVHCSAGVGRTGTFILLDRVMQQMKREGTLSIYNILKAMRGQRMKMVQTQVYVARYNAFQLWLTYYYSLSTGSVYIHP